MLVSARYSDTDKYGNVRFYATQDMCESKSYDTLKFLADKIKRKQPDSFNPIFTSTEGNSITISIDKRDFSKFRKGHTYDDSNSVYDMEFDLVRKTNTKGSKQIKLVPKTITINPRATKACVGVSCLDELLS